MLPCCEIHFRDLKICRNAASSTNLYRRIFGLLFINVMIAVGTWGSTLYAESSSESISSIQPIDIPHIHNIYMNDLLPTIFEIRSPLGYTFQEAKDPLFMEISGGTVRTIGESATAFGNILGAGARGDGRFKFNYSGAATIVHSRLFNNFANEILAFYGGMGLTSPYLSFHVGVSLHTAQRTDNTYVRSPDTKLSLSGVTGNLSCNGGIDCATSAGVSFFGYYTISKYVLINTLLSKPDNDYTVDSAGLNILRIGMINYYDRYQSIDAGLTVDSDSVYEVLNTPPPKNLFATLHANTVYRNANGQTFPYFSLRLNYSYVLLGISYTGLGTKLGYTAGLGLWRFMSEGKFEFSLSYYKNYPEFALRFAGDEGIILRGMAAF